MFPAEDFPVMYFPRCAGRRCTTSRIQITTKDSSPIIAFCSSPFPATNITLNNIFPKSGSPRYPFWLSLAYIPPEQADLAGGKIVYHMPADDALHGPSPGSAQAGIHGLAGASQLLRDLFCGHASLL